MISGFSFLRHTRPSSVHIQHIQQIQPKIAQCIAASSCSALRFGRASSTSSNGNDETLFSYTSGRWVWNEEAQLRNRYRPFNVAELKKLAVSVAGAKYCESIRKIGEGHFHKVFRLRMDDKSAVIARIPHRAKGAVSNSLRSEVATMDFVSVVNIDHS